MPAGLRPWYKVTWLLLLILAMPCTCGRRHDVPASARVVPDSSGLLWPCGPRLPLV